MKSLLIALLLAAVPAQAGTRIHWADIGCGEFVSTRDNKTFTWARSPGGIKPPEDVRCTVYAERNNARERIMICADGTTPLMQILSDDHIIWDQTEMWHPGGPICD